MGSLVNEDVVCMVADFDCAFSQLMGLAQERLKMAVIVKDSRGVPPKDLERWRIRYCAMEVFWKSLEEREEREGWPGPGVDWPGEKD